MVFRVNISNSSPTTISNGYITPQKLFPIQHRQQQKQQRRNNNNANKIANNIDNDGDDSIAVKKEKDESTSLVVLSSSQVQVEAQTQIEKELDETLVSSVSLIDSSYSSYLKYKDMTLKEKAVVFYGLASTADRTETRNGGRRGGRRNRGGGVAAGVIANVLLLSGSSHHSSASATNNNNNNNNITSSSSSKVYRNVFVGKDIIDTMLIDGLVQSREEALVLGNKLAKKLQLFTHVNDGSGSSGGTDRSILGNSSHHRRRGRKKTKKQKQKLTTIITKSHKKNAGIAQTLLLGRNSSSDHRCRREHDIDDNNDDTYSNFNNSNNDDDDDSHHNNNDNDNNSDDGSTQSDNSGAILIDDKHAFYAFARGAISIIKTIDSTEKNTAATATVVVVENAKSKKKKKATAAAAGKSGKYNNPSLVPSLPSSPSIIATTVSPSSSTAAIASAVSSQKGRHKRKECRPLPSPPSIVHEETLPAPPSGGESSTCTSILSSSSSSSSNNSSQGDYKKTGTKKMKYISMKHQQQSKAAKSAAKTTTTTKSSLLSSSSSSGMKMKMKSNKLKNSPFEDMFTVAVSSKKSSSSPSNSNGNKLPMDRKRLLLLSSPKKMKKYNLSKNSASSSYHSSSAVSSSANSSSMMKKMKLKEEIKLPSSLSSSPKKAKTMPKKISSSSDHHYGTVSSPSVLSSSKTTTTAYHKTTKSRNSGSDGKKTTMTTKDRLLPAIQNGYKATSSDEVVTKYANLLTELQDFMDRTVQHPDVNMLSSSPALVTTTRTDKVPILPARRKDSFLPSDIMTSIRNMKVNNDDDGIIDRSITSDNKEDEDNNDGDQFISPDDLISNNATLPFNDDDNNSVWTKFIMGRDNTTRKDTSAETSINNVKFITAENCQNTAPKTAAKKNKKKMATKKNITVNGNTVPFSPVEEEVEKEVDQKKNEDGKNHDASKVAVARVWKGAPSHYSDGLSGLASSCDNGEIMVLMEWPTVGSTTDDDIDAAENILIRIEQQPRNAVHCNRITHKNDDGDDKLELKEKTEKGKKTKNKRQTEAIKNMTKKEVFEMNTTAETGNLSNSKDYVSYSDNNTITSGSIMQAIEGDQFYQVAINDECNVGDGSKNSVPTTLMLNNDENAINEIFNNASHSSLPNLEDFSVSGDNSDNDDDGYDDANTTYSSYDGSYVGSSACTFTTISNDDSNGNDDDGDGDDIISYYDDITYTSDNSSYEEQTVSTENQNSSYQPQHRPNKFRPSKTLPKFEPTETELESQSIQLNRLPSISENYAHEYNNNPVIEMTGNDDEMSCLEDFSLSSRKLSMSPTPTEQRRDRRLSVSESRSKKNSTTALKNDRSLRHLLPVEEGERRWFDVVELTSPSTTRIKEILRDELTSTDYERVKYAVDELHLIVLKGEQCCKEIVQLGGIMNIMGAMKKFIKDREVQWLCYAILEKLAENTKTKNIIVKWDGIPLLEESIKNHTKDKHMKKLSRKVLTDLKNNHPAAGSFSK